MLVLSRKLNEVIWIGDEVKLTVVEVKGNRVKLGIEAPKTMNVRRDELGNDKPKGAA